MGEPVGPRWMFEVLSWGLATGLGGDERGSGAEREGDYGGGSCGSGGAGTESEGCREPWGRG